MKTTNVLGWILAAGLAVMTARGAAIFEDTFTNGDPSNSDVDGSNTITNFWKFQGNAGASQSESGGAISLTTPSGTADNRMNFMISSNAVSGANFFDEAITFSADVSLTGGSSFATDRAMRFYVSSASDYDWLCPSYIRLEIREDFNIYSYSRLTNGVANGLILGDTSNEDKSLARVSMTLNSTNYNYTLTFTDDTTANFSGAHYLTEADWGSDFYVGMAAYKKGTRNTYTTLNVDHYSIIPEPATMSMLLTTLAGALFVRRRMRGA
jgi:hypothetical protein